MNLELQLSSSELDAEDLQALTRQLCASITEESSIQANIPSGDAVEGAKGAVTLGMIILAFLADGAAVALCKVLETYFRQNPSLSVEVEIVKPDGTKIKLRAKNIEELEQLKNLLSL
jgi:hypothetical protein